MITSEKEFFNCHFLTELQAFVHALCLACRHFAYQNSVYFSRLRWVTTVAIKFSLSCQSDFIYSSVFPLQLFVLLFITYLTLLLIRMGYASTYFNHKRADLSLCRYFLSWLTTCIFFPNTWETGFEPGTFAAVQQYLHLDTLVLEQQNTKNAWGSKWLGAYTVRTNSGKREIKKPAATSEEPGAKAGYSACPPARNTTWGVGKPPKPPLWLDLWTHPYPHPV